MAEEYILVACYLDGKINITSNNEASYEGGNVASFPIRKSSNFEDLLDEIYKVSGSCKEETEFRIIFNCPVFEKRTTALPVRNDKEWSNVFIVGARVVIIELFVEKLPRRRDENFIGDGEESQRVVETQFDIPSSYHFPSGSPYMQGCCPLGGVGPSNVNVLERLPSFNVRERVHTMQNTGNVAFEGLDEDVNESYEEAPEYSMTIAEHESDDNDAWIENSRINNEDVPFDDLPDDIDVDEMVRISQIEDDFHDIDIPMFRDVGASHNFKIGDIFESKDIMLQSLREWSIRRSVTYKTIKSSNEYFEAICSLNERICSDTSITANAKCPWKLYAYAGKKTHHKFKITQFVEEHTCTNPIAQTDHKQATSTFICNVIMPMVKEKIDITPQDICIQMKTAYFIDVPYHRAWRARTAALSLIFGDWERSYETLPQYIDALERSNPGTVSKLTWSGGRGNGVVNFTGLFWAFGPSIEGFKHCRPVLSVDGTHLYGKYGGVLLVATGVDANGGLFPLAFAVVEVENEANWTWFFACMHSLIPSLKARREITFISDRMKGIENGLKAGWLSKYNHRFCMRHLRANFKRNVKDPESELNFYNAGCAKDKDTYKELRSKISEAGNRYIERSLGGNLRQWAQHKDGGKRYGIMTTNSSESFNDVLKGARA